MKSTASISLDLDNEWSYLKTHGDAGWESYPSYLDIVVPRVLAFFKARNLRVTFFIVGQDAALRKHHEILRSIADAGHEIGNHSFHHEPWMHLYSRVQIESEISLAEEHIERATGQKPVGFRGPGYSVSTTMLRELARRSYRYDASTLPSLLAPLARTYYFATAQFTKEQKRQRQTLGGTFRDGLRPIKPYRWHLDEGQIVEIPVTTMPIFRLPIHQSYLMCLGAGSSTLALAYFNIALRMCALADVAPSFLLHPTDFLGGDDKHRLSFFPGMNTPRGRKLEFLSEVIGALTAKFTLLTLQHHAQEIGRRTDLRAIEPRFVNPIPPGHNPYESAGFGPREK